MKYSLASSRIMAAILVSLIFAPTVYAEDPTPDQLFMQLDPKKPIEFRGERSGGAGGGYVIRLNGTVADEPVYSSGKAEGSKRLTRKERKKLRDENPELKGKKLKDLRYQSKNTVGEDNDIEENGFAKLKLGSGKTVYVQQPSDPKKSAKIFDDAGNEITDEAEIRGLLAQSVKIETMTLKEALRPAEGSSLRKALFAEYT
ncbi:MAG: hypothetical protein EOP09_00835, partial [Proteobacteria bacterium]